MDNQTCSLVWTTSLEEAQRLVELSDNDFINALNDVLSVITNIIEFINVYHFNNLNLSFRKKQSQTMVV